LGVDIKRADWLLRWIGGILGTIAGAALGYMLGVEEGGFLLALAWMAVGVPVGALLGILLVYILVGVLLLTAAVLSVLGLVIHVSALAVSDFLRRG
jgi:hypothetical protein